MPPVSTVNGMMPLLSAESGLMRCPTAISTVTGLTHPTC